MKCVVPYAVDYTRFPSSIFIKLDKNVFQRIRNNISFEFRVIFKVFQEENCQSMKDVFKRCKKKKRMPKYILCITETVGYDIVPHWPIRDIKTQLFRFVVLFSIFSFV